MGKKINHEGFLKRLLEKNNGYRDGAFEVAGDYTSALSKIRVKTKYGECDIEANSLMKGYSPTITSAVDKNQYCINMIQEVHRDLYDCTGLTFTGTKKKYLYYVVDMER